MSDHPWDFYCNVCTAALDDCLFGGQICDGCGSAHASLHDDDGASWCRRCKAECAVCGLVIPAGGKHCPECAAALEASEVMAPLRLKSLGVA
ncbi:MAG: hypothetical protein DIU78_013135 [Pseudomonadota bacterium]